MIRPLEEESAVFNRGAIGKIRVIVEIVPVSGELFAKFGGTVRQPSEPWDRLMITTLTPDVFQHGHFAMWETSFAILNLLGDELARIALADGGLRIDIGPFFTTMEGSFLLTIPDKRRLYATPGFPLRARADEASVRSDLPAILAKLHDGCIFAGLELGAAFRAPCTSKNFMVSHPQQGDAKGVHAVDGRVMAQYESPDPRGNIKTLPYDHCKWRREGLSVGGNTAYPLLEAEHAGIVGQLSSLPAPSLASAMQQLTALPQLRQEWPEEYARMLRWKPELVDSLPRVPSTDAYWPAFFLLAEGEERMRLVPGATPLVMQPRVVDAYFLVMSEDGTGAAGGVVGGDAGPNGPNSELMEALLGWACALSHPMSEEEACQVVPALQAKAGSEILRAYQRKAALKEGPNKSAEEAACQTTIEANMLLVNWLYRHTTEVRDAIHESRRATASLF